MYPKKYYSDYPTLLISLYIPHSHQYEKFIKMLEEYRYIIRNSELDASIQCWAWLT